jgi:hypothetical protein
MPARFEELPPELEVSRAAVQTVLETVDVVRRTCDAGGELYSDHVHPYTHALLQYATGALALYWLLRNVACFCTYKSLGSSRALRRSVALNGAR